MAIRRSYRDAPTVIQEKVPLPRAHESGRIGSWLLGFVAALSLLVVALGRPDGALIAPYTAVQPRTKSEAVSTATRLALSDASSKSKSKARRRASHR